MSNYGQVPAGVKVQVVCPPDRMGEVIRVSGIALVDGFPCSYGAVAHVVPGKEMDAVRNLIESVMEWRTRVEASGVWPETSWIEEDGTAVVQPALAFKSVAWHE